MSDNELDRLFKEAAEELKVPYDPSAWKGMEERLNRELPRKRGIYSVRKFMLLALLLAGTTGTITWWYATNADQKTDQTNVNGRILSQDIADESSQFIRERDVVSDTTDSSIILSETTTQQVPMAIEEAISKNKGTSQLNAPNKNNIQGSILNAEKSIPVSTTEDQKKGATLIQKEDNVILNQPHKIDSVATEVMAAKAVAPMDSTTVPLKEEKQNENVHRNTWSLKVSVSPDFSSINFFTPDKSGFNYGAQVAYGFQPRWTATLGVLNSKKIYTSEEVDDSYTTGSGYDYPINKLEGDCRVLDIPLNVYYSFVMRKTFSLQAGLGVSSYIMKEEEYTYYVDKPYGDTTYDATIEGENNEWFKILNISILVEKKINNRFSFELEPFVKAPMAGIGEGKVALVTMGAFFNVRYFFNPNKP